MTAKVFLAGGHHGLYKGEFFATHDTVPDLGELGWVELTPEMLDRPIKGFSGEELSGKWLKTYRAALRALVSLDGFISVVSFGATAGDEPQIRSPKREWGQIYLAKTGEAVVSFSHDTRHSNAPFTGLLQWVEDVPINASWDDEMKERMLRKWSSVEVWREFFLTRIKERAGELANKSADYYVKAESAQERSRGLQGALAKM